MKNKAMVAIFAGIMVAAFILGSTGMVSLAKEESMELAAKEKDRLIGIFVTMEHLDLFDFEGYLNENMNKVLNGGEISQSDSAKYEGRLYADLVERTLTDAESGRTSTAKEFVFEGVEGFLYYEAKIEEDGESYYTSNGDEAISDGHLGINVNDAGESIDMEGTIYMSASGTQNCLYFNPVYQTAEGAVYAVSGHGYSHSGEVSEGMIGSVTLEEKEESTLNGETVEVGTKIKMSYAFMFDPVKIVITQMSKDNQMVDSQEYKPGEVPKELVVETDTEYFIVETVKEDKEGKEIHTREMYQREDDMFETFFCREDGICVKKPTGIVWDK